MGEHECWFTESLIILIPVQLQSEWFSAREDFSEGIVFIKISYYQPEHQNGHIMAFASKASQERWEKIQNSLKTVWFSFEKVFKVYFE